MAHVAGDIGEYADTGRESGGAGSARLVRGLVPPEPLTFITLSITYSRSIPHYRLREAHQVLLRVETYARAHHCNGSFLRRRADYPSVVQDIFDDTASSSGG